MKPHSSPALVLLAAVITFIVVAFEVIPWLQTRTMLGRDIMVMSTVSTGIWMLTLWWALHHLVFKLAALWPTKPHIRSSRSNVPDSRILVFYVTCDDFDAECFKSCVEQDYPADRFRV